MALLELNRLSFRYPESSVDALRSISLEIPEASYVAIVGKNGSGKSTLLRLLNGLRLPSSGSVKVRGLDTASQENLHRIRSDLCLVFQSPPDQLVSSVVEEDVAFGPENLGLAPEEVRRRVDDALRRVGLEEERRRPTGFLSAGQQQRLAVAGALAMKPRCVAFDEATSMLDPAARVAILDLMDDLVSRGIAVIHVTHDMSEAARARRILVLEKGNLVFDGSPDALFGSDSDDFCAEDSLYPRAIAFGLDLPPAVSLALQLGLRPIARENAQGIAARIAGNFHAFPSGALRTVGPGATAPGIALLGSEASGTARPGAAASNWPLRASVTGTIPIPEAQSPAFVLEGASYVYLKATTNERKAISGLSFELPRGATLALVGRTGSGKSTALQLMNALAAPTSGKVLSFGIETTDKNADLKRLRTRAPLAIQRPESALFETYAGDDVAFGPRNLGLFGPRLIERVKKWMDAVALPYEAWRDRPIRSLSGGEKRKLVLAGVFALESDALLLDEPTSALDPAAKAELLGLLSAIGSSGKTLVTATHSMEEAARADFIAVFSGGDLAAFGSPAYVFYDAYDPAWEIGKPFAACVTEELKRQGFAFGGPSASGCERPLDLTSLISLLMRTMPSPETVPPPAAGIPLTAETALPPAAAMVGLQAGGGSA